MSRWLVISDNHGDREILQRLRQQLQPDAIFHCGDSEMAADDPWFQGVYAIQGNMDFDTALPQVLTPRVDDRQVLLTHGHHDRVNWDLTQLKLRADAAQAEAVFYGHTHQLTAEVVGGHLFVNPGSISQPRGEFQRLGGTCAVITVTADQWEVQFVTRDGQPVPELNFTFARSETQKG
ncbi:MULTISPECIES: metallophosphoesterase [Lactobacillaceae]|uniref:metallophosphoesterase n=1 Tax=Lactobacillaceae TaxID=33958 RepID=UPI00145758B0|nr:metallophosphoesterase [Lactobacillus sp. HBUAS51381]NLR09805.1 metallophosphoesterase [Lactobacillus sp. HBUAS51381]